MLFVELLDLRTLLLVLGLTILTMSITLLSAFLIDRDSDAFQRRLLLFFSLGLLLQGLSGMALGLRGIVPDWISISVANPFLLFGLAIQAGVIWRYFYRRMPWRAIVLFAGLGSVAFNVAVIRPDGYDLQHGTLIMSLMNATLTLTCAAIIAHNWRRSSLPARGFAGVQLLIGALFLLRAAESALTIDHALFTPLAINQLTILATTLSIPVLTVLFTLIIKEDVDQALRTTSEHLQALEEIEQQRIRIQELQIKSSQHEMIAHMARGIAHDFNNLLGVISLDHDQLLERLNEQPDQAELASLSADIDSALRQAQAITAGLMSLGSDELTPTRPVDIRSVLAGVDRIVSRALPERIAFDVGHDDCQLIGLTQPGYLTAALINLCWNARDAMTDGGVLKIHARQLSAGTLPEPVIGSFVSRPVIAITVEDSGQGIPADILPDLFKPTFSTKTNNRGHGLGLFMVAQFAKRTGAAICVESTAGAGTRFIIAIPTPPDPLDTEAV